MHGARVPLQTSPWALPPASPLPHSGPRLLPGSTQQDRRVELRVLPASCSPETASRGLGAKVKVGCSVLFCVTPVVQPESSCFAHSVQLPGLYIRKAIPLAINPVWVRVKVDLLIRFQRIFCLFSSGRRVSRFFFLQCLCKVFGIKVTFP